MDTKQHTPCAAPDAIYICPIENTLRILDGKWKVMILYALLTDGTLRFGELRKRLPGITQKMLTAQLRELERQRVIGRKVYPVVPPKVEYTLTSTGRSLRPVFEAMHQWSVEHQPKSWAS